MPLSHRTSVVASLLRTTRVTRVDLDARLRLLLSAIDRDPGATADLPALVRAAVVALTDAPRSTVWLALAVLRAELPTVAEVVDTDRAAQLEGPEAILLRAARQISRSTARRRVRIVADTTIIDLGELVTNPLGTGIQRVARQVTTQWVAHHEATLVGWTAAGDALRALSPEEQRDALDGTVPHDAATRERRSAEHETVIVPWRCTYLLPELTVDARRCAALQSLATHSENRTAVIGFDLVPVTSAETSAAGFANGFALNLAAVAHFDVVGAISAAAATEYSGWSRMLAGTGLPGPQIVEVPLPGHAPEPTPDDLAEAAARLLVPGMPLVLVVGSHEPRKNHLAVLHAAEILWRRGHRFSLSFVGGNSWGSEEFTARLEALRGAGRAVESISRMPDGLLWAAYRLARFTVFPSINEGFGLPVAESLSAGTPALTSGYGSMAEIAEHGGALLVDPRDDEAVVEAFARLLVDDALVDHLVHEARRRPPTSWADYAERLWDSFHAG
ncbi:glycosyltransferase [Actinotalea sp.]|uniref:glycosyltransferase n=1 Tax=Actinotalea sp. TaxID=1872145 RepID=UPI003561FE10